MLTLQTLDNDMWLPPAGPELRMGDGKWKLTINNAPAGWEGVTSQWRIESNVGWLSLSLGRGGRLAVLLDGLRGLPHLRVQVDQHSTASESKLVNCYYVCIQQHEL